MHVYVLVCLFLLYSQQWWACVHIFCVHWLKLATKLAPTKDYSRALLRHCDHFGGKTSRNLQGFWMSVINPSRYSSLSLNAYSWLQQRDEPCSSTSFCQQWSFVYLQRAILRISKLQDMLIVTYQLSSNISRIFIFYMHACTFLRKKLSCVSQ